MPRIASLEVLVVRRVFPGSVVSMDDFIEWDPAWLEEEAEAPTEDVYLYRSNYQFYRDEQSAYIDFRTFCALGYLQIDEEARFLERVHPSREGLFYYCIRFSTKPVHFDEAIFAELLYYAFACSFVVLGATRADTMWIHNPFQRLELNEAWTKTFGFVLPLSVEEITRSAYKERRREIFLRSGTCYTKPR